MISLREGYRPFFPLGAAIAVVVLSAWAAALAGVGPGLLPAVHAQVLLWGAYGAVVGGFLLTAYPKQNDEPGPTRAAIGGAAAVHATAWLLAGVLPIVTTILVAGEGIVLTVWAARIALPSLRRRWDPTTAAVPLVLAAFTSGWCVSRLGDTRLGLDVGLHLGLLPLALSVLDRVLPFFSRVVPGYAGHRRAHAPLLFFAAGALRFVHPVAGDVASLAALAYAWTGWRLHLRPPMIGVLHLGLGWCALGWGLDAAPLGLPSTFALHAWTIGGLGTLLLGLAMRVTLGHGGRRVELLPIGAVALVLLQLAAVARMGGVLAEAPAIVAAAAALLAGAFFVWLVGFARLAST